MRFLVDECTGPAIAADLREQGHDVVSVYDACRGIDDVRLLEMAVAENRILVTADKGFGDKVYRRRLPHRGVILLRLEDQRPVKQNEVLRRLLSRYSEKLSGNFVVVSERAARFAESGSG